LNSFEDFKKELDHLVKIGVLAAQQESEWASGIALIHYSQERWQSMLD
jgi:hypothetical protein